MLCCLCNTPCIHASNVSPEEGIGVYIGALGPTNSFRMPAKPRPWRILLAPLKLKFVVNDEACLWGLHKKGKERRTKQKFVCLRMMQSLCIVAPLDMDGKLQSLSNHFLYPLLQRFSQV